MNYSVILYILGIVLKFEALFLSLPILTGLFYQEKSTYAFVITMLLCLTLGTALSYKKPKSSVFYALEGFLSVSLSWIVLSIFGALPFCISGEIPSFTNALFESISGFTTTGASILSDVEALSHCCLFWRSFTHWIGGMGVLVFVLAVFPMSGGHRMYLMKAESPGPSVEKFVPKVKNTAMILYGIYTVITLVEIVLLVVTGMPTFDAITLSFGTVGTGGFGVRNDSIAGYAPHLQIIITVFMILCGTNFNIYYLAISGKFRQIIRSEEARAYLGIIVGTTLIIAYNVRHLFPTIREALLHSVFQVSSIITTTGYTTTNYELWPELSRTLLLILTILGACAGSTGGGIKVSRILIMFKTICKELFTFVHPRGVKKVYMDGRPVEHETIRSVNVFMAAYLFIFVCALLLVSLDNYDFITNFSAVATTLGNVGPGFNLVGPTGNFDLFSPLSKYVLMFNMLTGRLEIFPMLVLLAPVTWRRK